jgi:hypothetical protein
MRLVLCISVKVPVGGEYVVVLSYHLRFHIPGFLIPIVSGRSGGRSSPSLNPVMIRFRYDVLDFGIWTNVPSSSSSPNRFRSSELR